MHFITKTCPCNIQRFFFFFFFFFFFLGCKKCNEYPQSMFGVKIRKIGIPLHTPVLLHKSGVQGDIHFTDIFP